MSRNIVIFNNIVLCLAAFILGNCADPDDVLVLLGYTGCTCLTLCILMDSSFWFNTINLGESIVHIQGCQKNIVFFFLKIFFTFQSVWTLKKCSSSGSSLLEKVLI